MPSLEESFELACSNGTIPGAVLLATDKTGDFKYSASFGVLSLEEGKKKPLEEDAIMVIASCTKLITTIAVLQCVERDLISLDDDLATILPELAALEILRGINDKGVPELKKRKNKITLRLLLTHSSGLIYTTMSPLHQEYHTRTKIPLADSNPTIVTRFIDPLLFEPGKHWHYGCGIDWAGLVVERLTKVSLEDYMREHIWNPLGIDDITFWPDKHPSIKARIASLAIRDPSVPEGKAKVIHYSGPDLFAGVTDCMGGQGAFASMPSYLKILHSILADDEKLLTNKTSAMMFRPQLTSQSQEAIQEKFGKDRTALHIGEFPETGLYDWGLGGVLMMNDTDEEWGAWRRNRCLIWSGLPNLFWWIDREADLCGIYGGQVIPAGDSQTKEMIVLFEKTMYQRLSQHKNAKA